MFAFIIIVSVAIQALVALFVLLKNTKSLTNILFFCLSAAVSAWAVINFITTRDPFSSAQLTMLRWLMATVVIQNTFFLLFAYTYPGNRILLGSRKTLLYILFSLLVVADALSPILFTKVNYARGGAHPVGGPGMLLFIVHAGLSVFYGLRNIFRQFKKAAGVTRQQLKIIFVASAILWGVVPVTNFGITMVTQTLFFAKISPLYTLAFSSIIAYAIVAQKLFDIRAAVARSVGYLLVVLSITLVYGVGLFGVIDVVFKGPSHETLRQVLSVILITPLALVFQRTKQFFDRATTHLFYRDAYDIQDVIDELGRAVVSEIELYQILRDTRAILTKALKTSFIEFILIKNGKAYFEAYNTNSISRPLLDLKASIDEQRKELVVVEEMSATSPLHEKFRESNVAVSLRLKTQEQVVGYILLGDKRSGNIFSSQDRRLLEIVASQLAVTLQNALRFEEIQNFNLTLQARIEDATRKLRHTNERLKQLDETKDDFVSMASHQLRTPLTSIKGYTSMVLEGDAGKINATQRQLLEQAFFSSQRMVYLIADLLNVSRLKTGKFIIEPSPVNLAELVEQEISQLKETAAGRQLELTYEQPKEFPTLMLDETKIRQVVMNFCDNAIYYTPAGGHITVKLIDTGSAVELRVVDNGIGVPKSEQPHLFTKFYRAGNARTARPDGTGLGLFMAKKVIVASGGAIIFETVEGKGSTFGFSFPKSTLEAPTAATPVKGGRKLTKTS